MSWPEALELLSAELGEPITFRVAAERQFLERLIGAGVPAGEAELLIAREWAILAGENDYTTDTFRQITGRPPPSVAELLHDHRAEFVWSPRLTLTRSQVQACLSHRPRTKWALLARPAVSLRRVIDQLRHRAEIVETTVLNGVALGIKLALCASSLLPEKPCSGRTRPSPPSLRRPACLSP